MCGIVCFYGQSEGVTHVLDALELLAYRAPDSSGVGLIGHDGRFAVRKAVGTSDQLREKLAEDPLPEILPGDVQVVVGHGRWAMVGEVNETNAHPLLDRGQRRMVCENGSHNAALMLDVFAEQEHWWRDRGVPADQPVHRSENTTEVIAFEWERMACLLAEGSPPPGSGEFLEKVDGQAVVDPEERALRLAIWRLRKGNSHACACSSLLRPDVLYVTSHRKPVALAIRHLEDGSSAVMAASDINAALMLFSKEEVSEAAQRIEKLQKAARKDASASPANEELQEILDSFTVDVVYLDNELNNGEELFARIDNQGGEGCPSPAVHVSCYDGTPIPVTAQSIRLNPAMVGKRNHPSYTESHIAEIPDVMDGIAAHYVIDGVPAMESARKNSHPLVPGLNKDTLQAKFGSQLQSLGRLLLIGEGSSWRDAQAAAPLFRQLLPGVVVNVYRPVQVLNLGQSIDPDSDLAVEISWSGTTDSLLKVDSWLREADVIRLGITGRPQSDLGRRTANSGGTLDVRTGVEVSVATVKGFQAILMTLNLLALQVGSMRQDGIEGSTLAQLIEELTVVIPGHVREVITDDQQRKRLRQVAIRCRHFNKVVIVGSSPVDIEGELKIEELAQVVARTSDFHAASLRPLIERSAMVDRDQRRVLFIINATSGEAHREAKYVINYLRELGVFCIIHATPSDQVDTWQILPNTEVFVSPAASEPLQALIDAPFFFDFAVALAYARGLSPDEIDRPRNLAKSVTVTGAEKREIVESRNQFNNISMTEFTEGQDGQDARNKMAAGPSTAAFRTAVSLRSAMAVINEPLSEKLDLLEVEHVVVLTNNEAIEIGAGMAAAAWMDLLEIDLTVYRRFIEEPPEVEPDTALLRVVQAGGLITVRESQTITLPSDLSPAQLERLAAVYLTGLAVRLARLREAKIANWSEGLIRIPLILSEILSDQEMKTRIKSVLEPFVTAGYDKVQIIGGGQDHVAAKSIARSIRSQGFLAEALYTDSAWHGPLAAVGGPDADHDTLIIILAADPLFQSTALVDTQVYNTRHAQVILLVPEGLRDLPAVEGVGAKGIISIPAVPRVFLPLVNAAVGSILAEQLASLWEEKENG